MKMNLVTVPCAFQIRFGGCKGVVAVHPGMTQLHPGKRMLFRKSMLKYWSTHRTIELLACCALPQELYLNQQVSSDVCCLIILECR